MESLRKIAKDPQVDPRDARLAKKARDNINKWLNAFLARRQKSHPFHITGIHDRQSKKD
jgi:hypothetical protein